MTDRGRRIAGTALAVAAIAFALTATVVYLVTGEAALFVDDWIVHNVVGTLIFGAVALVGVRSRPRNLAVWAFVWIALFGSLQTLGAGVGLAVSGFSNSDIQAGIPLAPADLDLLAAVAFNVASWVWVPVVFGIGTVALVVFPHGRFHGRIDRWLAGIAAVLIASTALTLGWLSRPWSTTTYETAAETTQNLIVPMFGTLVLLALVVLARLVLRARRATGEARLQYRWGLWGIGVFVVSQLLLLIDLRVFQIASIAVVVNLAISLGVAVLRYRLFQIDVIINRTVVFAGLAVLILAIYAPVVVGVGEAVGGSGLWLPIVSTAVIAIVFEPARQRLQKWANRLVYGRRATPYEVLSDLTGRLAGAEREEGLFERMAERLAEGTGAARAVVWVAEDDGLRPAAAAPADELPASVPSLDDLPGTAAPIRRDGDLLGALTVEKRRGDAITPTEQDLVDDLAGSAGLVLRRLRLDAALAEKAAELQESRLRL
ncbi:MAG: hypothetical protein R3290_13665, partial [Acidimicrobiia bacterium]|nr:hypothetical protein [Acidimicrobiia bacterium]